MTGKLVCVVSKNPVLRTPEVVGHFPHNPALGHCFWIFAEAIDGAADGRFVRTSPIKEISKSCLNGAPVWEFKTGNSTYRLTVVLKDEEVAN